MTLIGSDTTDFMEEAQSFDSRPSEWEVYKNKKGYKTRAKGVSRDISTESPNVCRGKKIYLFENDAYRS